MSWKKRKVSKVSEVSKRKNDLPQLKIPSDHHENLVIIDQEYDKVVIISTKRRIRAFPLPQ